MEWFIDKVDNGHTSTNISYIPLLNKNWRFFYYHGTIIDGFQKAIIWDKKK